jgi:hypothetical protein
MAEAQLYVLVGLLAALWFILLLLQGVNPGLAFFKPLSSVVGATGILLVVFDRWLWRVRILHPWFVGVPVINGTWRGEIVTTWVDTKTGSPPPPIETYIVIRQTLSRVQMNLVTKESQSDLLAGSIVKDGKGVYRLTGIYLNTPKAQVRHRSEIHYGGVVLQIQGDPPQALEGGYWTDRLSRGDLKFTRRVSRLCCGFDDAARAFEEER